MRKRVIKNLKEIVHEIRGRDVCELAPFFPEIDFSARIYPKRMLYNFILCPFHDEYGPSFTYSIEKGFWYCYGCGNCGDIISFFSQLKKMEFYPSVIRLAKFFKIKVQFETVKMHKKNSIRE